VILSPNARIRVTASFRGDRIVTLNAQFAVCCNASDARHVTSVEPIWNALPESGEHPTVTGWCPPVAGTWKCTTVGVPSNDCP
jgi:hypothetical protein